VQDQVSLDFPARAEPDRLELEGQVVAERAEQGERVVGTGEQRDDLPDRAEHGRAAAALFLGQLFGGLGDRYQDAGVVALGQFACFGDRCRDRGQEHAAAVVERGRGELAAAAGELDARVDVGGVPAAVPARVLHARAEHPAAPVVDQLGDLGHLVRLERGDRSGHLDAARGDEPRGSWLRHRTEIRAVIHALDHLPCPACSGPD
jgi:hypothetical protein